MFAQETIERFKTLETPFYYYDLELLKQTLQEVKTYGIDQGYHVHYALKANFDSKVLETIKSYGLGIDAVSANEIKKALESGYNSDQVVFAGVGKSDSEINFALDNDIFCFNCESIQEIEVINELAGRKGKKAAFALRINPNVDPKTHKFITTGLSENKFGINPWEIAEILDKLPTLSNMELKGVHFHIGSQITDISRYEIMCNKVNDILTIFDDHKIALQHINVGGGLGIDYEQPDENSIPPFREYFDVFSKFLNLKQGQELHFELGRSIVCQCGSFITKVLYIKPSKTTNFAIVDGGMTELIRPMLYQAHHEIQCLTSNKPDKTYDVVGPICESTDTFAKKIQLPECQRGDLIAIRSAGAYGQVMSSNYNLRDDAKAIH